MANKRRIILCDSSCCPKGSWIPEEEFRLHLAQQYLDGYGIDFGSLGDKHKDVLEAVFSAMLDAESKCVQGKRAISRFG